jgi:hypothetical protein
MFSLWPPQKRLQTQKGQPSLLSEYGRGRFRRRCVRERSSDEHLAPPGWSFRYCRERAETTRAWRNQAADSEPIILFWDYPERGLINQGFPVPVASLGEIHKHSAVPRGP